MAGWSPDAWRGGETCTASLALSIAGLKRPPGRALDLLLHTGMSSKTSAAQIALHPPRSKWDAEEDPVGHHLVIHSCSCHCDDNNGNG